MNKTVDRRGAPRICMPSSRRFRRKTFQCGVYEAQDVLVESDDVELLELQPAAGFNLRNSWQNRLIFRDVTNSLVLSNPGLRPVQLTREYDLFLAAPQTWEDFRDINAVVGWKDHCKISACWIDEIWAASIEKYSHWLRMFERFDHIFIGYHGTVAPLARALGRPVHWLPPAVDVIRFSPFPHLPERPIDAYSIGRRWEGVHHALLSLADQGQFFYLHDTLRASVADVFNHRHHRNMYANLAKRSRNFIVAPAKVDVVEQTRGQVEIGYRYFEAAAAGAVMLGGPPDCLHFRELFDWPDVVIELNKDGSNTLEVLRGLREDPVRVSAISARNAAEALRRHDWMYRWKTLLGIAGLAMHDRMRSREQHLKDLGDHSG